MMLWSRYLTGLWAGPEATTHHSAINMQNWTARQAVEHIKSGVTTVEDYAKALLSRYEERDETVKAWTWIGRHIVHVQRLRTTEFVLDKENILYQARRLDALPSSERGPLHGVAVGIKDIMETKGKSQHCTFKLAVSFKADMPTEFGSPLYRHTDQMSTHRLFPFYEARVPLYLVSTPNASITDVAKVLRR